MNGNYCGNRQRKKKQQWDKAKLSHLVELDWTLLIVKSLDLCFFFHCAIVVTDKWAVNIFNMRFSMQYQYSHANYLLSETLLSIVKWEHVQMNISVVERVFGFFRRRGKSVSWLLNYFTFSQSNWTSSSFEIISFVFFINGNLILFDWRIRPRDWNLFMVVGFRNHV